jgi:hypothetical protein
VVRNQNDESCLHVHVSSRSSVQDGDCCGVRESYVVSTCLCLVLSGIATVHHIHLRTNKELQISQS